MTNDVTAEKSLANVQLLSGLPAESLAQIADVCELRTCRPGARVIERGENTRDVYFILSGRVNVMNFAASGRVVAFASLEAGELFGELAALDGLPRSATVVAATACTFAVLPPQEFRRLLPAHPELALMLMVRLAQVIRNCDDRIFNLSSLGAPQRICLELLRLSEPDPAQQDRWAIYPMPTQAALANVAGTARETVARVIRDLATQGVIERKSKSLYIYDRKSLETHALKVKVPD